jgi:hypothetical protein
MRLPPGRRAFTVTALSKFHFSNSPPPTCVAHLWSIAFLAECDRSTLHRCLATVSPPTQVQFPSFPTSPLMRGICIIALFLTFRSQTLLLLL